MWYRFHDEHLHLDVRRTMRLHWVANRRMLTRIAPTVTFIGVSVIPAMAWVATSLIVARLFPVTPGTWTLLGDRLIDALLIGLVPYLLLQHIAFMVAIEATYAPIVREVLTEMGLPVCPGCGHRLDPARVGPVRAGMTRLGQARSGQGWVGAPDAVEGTSCPECGAVFPPTA